MSELDTAGATETALTEQPPSGARSAPATAFSRWLQVVAGAVVTIAVWAVVALWGLGATPFHTKGEPREGLVVWEMTHGGGWILPPRNGTELPSKPPLFHWLGAFTSLSTGSVNEWSIRFPSALLSLFGALLVLGAGTAWWSPRAGLLAALILMTTFEWARAATNARVDMTLTFGLEVAALSLFFFWPERRTVWLTPLYLGSAWAVLGKGPVGVVLPVLTAATLIALTFDRVALRDNRWAAVFDWPPDLAKALLRGAAVVALLAGSWYVLALFIGGWPFFRKQILAENIFTFLDDADFGGGHRHGLLYLPVQLLLGMMPWALFLPGVAVALWRARATLSLRRDARTLLVVWSLVVLVFYQAAASKRGVYLLAAYPTLALLLGWWWSEQWERLDSERWLARLTEWVCTLLTAVAIVTALVILLNGLGVPLMRLSERWTPAKAASDIAVVATVLGIHWWKLVLGFLFTAVAFVAARQAARRGRWSWIFPNILAATVVLLLMVRIIVMPAVAEQLTLRDFMRATRSIVGSTENLSFYRTFDYGAVFYSQGHIRRLDGPWPTDGPGFLLVERGYWDSNRTTAANLYEAVPIEPGLKAPPTELVLLRRIAAQAGASQPQD